jgi:hypothetical protein
VISASDRRDDAGIVAAQLGRAPREPWRTASVCPHGYPSAIVSPSRLADGTPFPTFAWLTCPWLAERASAEESEGASARWVAEIARDSELAERLRITDAAMRMARAAEGLGVDACETVGVAGQRDPLAVKCLHARVALALTGIDDPVGVDLIGRYGVRCPDRRCEEPGIPCEMEE